MFGSSSARRRGAHRKTSGLLGSVAVGVISLVASLTTAGAPAGALTLPPLPTDLSTAIALGSSSVPATAGIGYIGFSSVTFSFTDHGLFPSSAPTATLSFPGGTSASSVTSHTAGTTCTLINASAVTLSATSLAARKTDSCTVSYVVEQVGTFTLASKATQKNLESNTKNNTATATVTGTKAAVTLNTSVTVTRAADPVGDGWAPGFGEVSQAFNVTFTLTQSGPQPDPQASAVISPWTAVTSTTGTPGTIEINSALPEIDPDGSVCAWTDASHQSITLVAGPFSSPAWTSISCSFTITATIDYNGSYLAFVSKASTGLDSSVMTELGNGATTVVTSFQIVTFPTELGVTLAGPSGTQYAGTPMHYTATVDYTDVLLHSTAYNPTLYVTFGNGTQITAPPGCVVYNAQAGDAQCTLPANMNDSDPVASFDFTVTAEIPNPHFAFEGLVLTFNSNDAPNFNPEIYTDVEPPLN